MRRGPTGLGNPHEAGYFWPAFRDPGAGQPPEKEVVYDPRCDPAREMEYRRNRMSQMCCALKECFKSQVRFEKSPAQIEPPFHARPFMVFGYFDADWSIDEVAHVAVINTNWIGNWMSVSVAINAFLPPYLTMLGGCGVREVQARHRLVVTAVGFDVTAVPQNAVRWSLGTMDVNLAANPSESQPPLFMETDDQSAAIPWPPPHNGV